MFTGGVDFHTPFPTRQMGLASRTILGAERTLVASRSGTGLAVASSTGGALVTETIEANANPSNIFVSVGTRGAGLVSYWNGTRYRFALQVDPGTGNGGPSSNWRCGNVPLLPGATGLLPDKIVGQADALLNAYFLVKARTATGGASDGIYYMVRSASGTWTASPNVAPGTLAMQSPVAIEVISSTQIGFMTAGGGEATVGKVTSGGISVMFGNIPGVQAPNGDMEQTTGPGKFCASENQSPLSGAPAGTADIRYVKRSPNTGVWLRYQTVLATGEYALHSCSIQVPANGNPVVAYATKTGTVRLWRFGLFETVDATSTYSKPILELTPANKLLILYQGAGFLKFGCEQ